MTLSTPATRTASKSDSVRILIRYPGIAKQAMLIRISAPGVHLTSACASVLRMRGTTSSFSSLRFSQGMELTSSLLRKLMIACRAPRDAFPIAESNAAIACFFSLCLPAPLKITASGVINARIATNTRIATTAIASLLSFFSPLPSMFRTAL